MPAAIDHRLIQRATTRARLGTAVFAVVRNQAYFLPFFVAHYRALGSGPS